MKEIYYYYRDKNNRPVVTVCLIVGKRNRKLVALGISICSPKDNPCKEIGRYYARERAIKAFVDKNSFDPIVGKEELQVIINATEKGNSFWNNYPKAFYPVEVSDFETKLIQMAKDN